MAAVSVDPKQQAMSSNPRGRLYFVDWLRVVLTINVVVMHAMLTYTSDDGAGMWSGQIAAAENEPVLNAMFWFFSLGGWAFRMMLFFTLAGYFTRRSYHSKGPARFLWDRTLRLLLPAIAYSCLVQPFLFWISDSSDSAVAAAYEAEVEDYGEFYVDALGNELAVPPPHTRTLGQWYKAYFTEPGLFGFDGPVWFVYNLWWFTVGYVLLMLIADSATFRKIYHRVTTSCKQAALSINNHSRRLQQLPALPVSSNSVVLQVGSEAPTQTSPAPLTAGRDPAGHSRASSSSGAAAFSVIIEPSSEPAAATAAKNLSTAPAGPDATAADGAAAAGNGAAAASVDSTKVTEPFPMRRVLLSGACVILSLWVAQFLVRLIMYYTAAATGDESADFYSTVSYYLISFEPAFIPQYIAAYTLGILAQKHNGLLRLPAELGIWCVCSSALFYVLAWAILWIFEDLRQAEYWGKLPANAPQLLYVLAYGFVEMTFGVVWGVGWLVMFREMFNSKPKTFGAMLIGAAYGVYLIHPIFITLYCRMLEHAEFPTFIVNSIFVAYLTVPSSWLVAVLLKRIPGANRIL